MLSYYLGRSERPISPDSASMIDMHDECVQPEMGHAIRNAHRKLPSKALVAGDELDGLARPRAC